MNIADAFFIRARERPAHPALEDGNRVVTYSELAALVSRAADGFRARGIQHRDIVAISLPDSAEHLAVLLGLAKIGAISLSIDERAPDPEKAKAVRGLTIKAAIVRDGGATVLGGATISLGALFRRQTGPARASGPPAPEPTFDANGPAMVAQSSGTTGDPKRLFVSHRQLIERNLALMDRLRLNAADRFLQVPYLRFFWGREAAILILTIGATVVLNRGAGAKDFVRYFTDRGITYTNFTPFHLRSILAHVTSDTPLWPTLKIAASSAPLSAAERLLVRARVTPFLIETYGTNEIGDLTLADPADQDRYPDSVGRVIAGMEAEIVDDDGALLAFGEIGEIRCRCGHFPREYLDNPEATARHFKDGWFYPGDLAAMNEEGYVFLKGRTDDVINNSGAKYFPAEVEAVLVTHPAVTDAAVIGGAHEKFGEVSVAYVTRSSPVTPKELRDFCKGKIAMYKAPQWCFTLKELPRVATGKPDKKKLKQMFRHYLETNPD